MAALDHTPAPADKGIPTLVSELWALVVDYAKQETIVPIKGLARFVALGLAGSVTLSIGLVMLVVSLLRALQTETGTAFTGNLSWAPYGITLVGSAVLAGLAARAIGNHKRRAGGHGTRA